MRSPRQVVLIDYGAGNLRSVHKALAKVGAEVLQTSDAKALRSADAVVLPGVGAFGAAVRNLETTGWLEPLRAYWQADKPFLGICLGLQLLFASSAESPNERGLGVLAGKVVRLKPAPAHQPLKVPHMGWNSLTMARQADLFTGLTAKPYVYFVHSYYIKMAPGQEQLVLSTTDYGISFVSGIAQGARVAVQFHPEKSGAVGLKFLENFLVNLAK